MVQKYEGMECHNRSPEKKLDKLSKYAFNNSQQLILTLKLITNEDIPEI
jgi:hypothetical protein